MPRSLKLADLLKTHLASYGLGENAEMITNWTFPSRNVVMNRRVETLRANHFVPSNSQRNRAATIQIERIIATTIANTMAASSGNGNTFAVIRLSAIHQNQIMSVFACFHRGRQQYVDVYPR